MTGPAAIEEPAAAAKNSGGLRRLGSFLWAQRGPAAEMALVLVWALFVGRKYLDLSPQVFPFGREFSSGIQTHFVWLQLAKCGACVFWNGFMQGGAPAFAELHGSLLHPLVIITTLVWGGLSGSKLALVASLAMAGLAQWWLAKVMRLSAVPRLWSAGLAVVGGHLAGRMELGAFGVVLSTAACSLVLAPALDLARNGGSRRTAAVLGVTLGLALLAGQGYMQVGLLLGTLPAALILLIDEHWKVRPVWKDFLLAGGLALLVAGVLLVPLLHFWPEIYKEIDPSFTSAQPLEYGPLNLVIRDTAFFTDTALGKLPYPHLNVNYIGWIPVLFALAALRLAPRSESRLLLFFLTAIGLLYLVSSAVALRWLAVVLPTFAAGVRHPSQIAGLAVPLVLALAAWGLDGLLRLNWPTLALVTPGPASSGSAAGLRLSWVILILPLLWSLKAAFDFSQTWLTTSAGDSGMRVVVQALKTDTAEWVSFPFGEHFWMAPALEANLKIGRGIRTWNWKEHDFPPSFREATRDAVDPADPHFVMAVGGLNIVAHPENEYALVETSGGLVPCRAQAQGGDIDVDCQTAAPGQLTVRENFFSGWSVRRDGAAAALGAGPWLTVQAPAGEHHYTFRYRPWDAPLGILLSLAGLALAVWLWFRPAAAAA